MMQEENTGLVEGSTVMTLAGAKAVEALRPGDRVITRSGALVLRDIEVRSVRNARLVRISASALGSDCPDADITIAADQPILVRDWRAQALTGTDRAMIPSAHLADGEYIRAEARRESRIFRLCFDVAAVIYAQGLEFGCERVSVTA